jgi:hypothetical protein
MQYWVSVASTAGSGIIKKGKKHKDRRIKREKGIKGIIQRYHWLFG